jgi:hypothetical protein
MKKYLIVFSILLLLAALLYAQPGPISPWVIRFLDLVDTPSTFTGQTLKYVRVNAAETDLEFVALGGGGDMAKATYDVLDDGLVDADNAAYGAGWNGSINAASQDALYDKIEALGGGFDSTTVDSTTWSDGANASNVWTFDVSGTDHTMTIGNGLITFSHGVTVTGALTGTLTGNADTATALATARAIGGVNFDGTAAITPTTIVVADTADATSYVALWESATGSLLPKSDAGLTYNATTANLSATTFTGALTGNVTGNADTVTNGVYTTDNLSVLAATTSAQLYGLLSDETGSGAGAPLAVFNQAPTIDSPTFTTDITAVDLIDGTELSDTITLDAPLLFTGNDIKVQDGFGLVIGSAAQVDIGNLMEFEILGTGATDTGMGIAKWSVTLATSPTIRFMKSHDATIPNNTIVLDDSHIGAIDWYPADGVDFDTVAAEFRAEVDDATPAVGDIGMAFVWEQMPGGGGAIAETMRLSATGVLSPTGLEIPNSAAPTTDATGEIALDTTITDHQPLLQYFDGGENMTVIAIDTAELPALDNEIIKYDAATDKFVLEADVGAGGGNDTYIEEGDAAKVDSSLADLYVDFDGTNFDVGVVGNEANITLAADGIDSANYIADSIDNEHINWVDIDYLGDEGALTVTDSIYASCYVAIFEAATGDLAIHTDGALTYDADSGNLSATYFTGEGSGLTNLDGENIGDNTIDEDSIDWGAGAGQINLADIPGGVGAGATVWDFGGTASLEIPNGTDPDVAVAGQISNDTDGANETGDVSIRGYDGSNQFLIARKLKCLCQATIIKPNGLADAQRDKCRIGINNSGMTFTILQIEAEADVDDTAFTLLEFDNDGASNQATVDAVNCTTGSGPYTANETAITGATIESGHKIYIDFDDTDDPGIVSVSVWGWYNADVD